MKHPSRDLWPRRVRSGHGRGSALRLGRPAALAAAVGLVLLAACAGPAEHPAAQGSVSAGEGRGSNSGGKPGTAQRPANLDARSGVIGGALFGGTSLLAPEEAALGRKLAIVRVYSRIGHPFPGPTDRQLMAGGRTLLVSLDSVPGSGPSYASIIAGAHDAAISAFLKEVNHSAIRYHLGAIYVAFEHEADNIRHLELGSPSQFVRAWDHIHQLAESAHLDWNRGGRLHWVWILEQSAFTAPGAILPRWDRAGGATAYWPGASQVDIVAADGYNSGLCKANGFVPRETRATAPAALFGQVIAFASSHGGLPVFIAEWGSTSYALPGVQPDFIHQMQAYVTANPEIGAALYWDGGQGGRCSYGVNGHPDSVAALATMGQSAPLQGHLTPAN
jgi:hypothetical protein